MFEKVFEASRIVDDIDCSRTLSDVLGTVMEEVGELSTEIGIHNGFKDRDPGRDGIVGEAIDGIIALIDVIYLAKPGVKRDELMEILESKCQKWIDGEQRKHDRRAVADG